MKIISIFELSKGSLFAVKYEGEDLDALEVLQEQWSDVEFLREFFKKYKKDYESYYPKAKLNKIVLQTIEDADALFELLYDLAEDKTGKSLADYFKPLDNREKEKAYLLQALKAYGPQSNSFLRIYAIRYGSSFVITGGAIKLTHQMADRPHTKLELHKLEWVKKYLHEDGETPEFVYLDLDNDE
ncbi:hypothetical protein [Fontibacter flavus]|uniref:Uncharacterized protein n=1 Tax=Fontibacter flavus TaxID=654838 RepID=A0ABV6FSZ1_9BACT